MEKGPQSVTPECSASLSGYWSRLPGLLLFGLLLFAAGCSQNRSRTASTPPVITVSPEDMKRLRADQGVTEAHDPVMNNSVGATAEAQHTIGIPIYPGARVLPGRTLNPQKDGPLQGVTSLELISNARKASVVEWYRSKFPGTFTVDSSVQPTKPLSIVQTVEAKNLVKIVSIGGKDGAIEIKLLRASAGGDNSVSSRISRSPTTGSAVAKSLPTVAPQVNENIRTSMEKIKLPLYPDAKRLNGTVASMGKDSPLAQTTVLLQSDKNTEDVVDWYRRHLKQPEVTEQIVADGKIVTFNVRDENGDSCIVSVMGNKQKTNITLMRINVKQGQFPSQ